jgi:uncharacterized membrane protein
MPLLGAVGIGGVIMALLDPIAGGRRRSRLREGITHALDNTGDVIGKAARDLGNRTTGFAAQTVSAFRKDDLSDEALVARVRSKLGRLVSHPHAIEVYADQGRVTLAGPVLHHELKWLINQIGRMPGVRSVDNHLEPHRSEENIPGLQGGRRREGERFELMHEHWSPTTRLLSTIGGGALLGYGIRRGDLTGAALSLLGTGLFARGATGRRINRLIGMGGNHRTVDFQKTLNIQAPINVVYDFWSNLENFPRFISRVRKVVDQGDGIFHWTVDGPAGLPVEWSAVITEQVPNRMLSWVSLPGTGIDNAGSIRFDQNPDGSTRLNIRFSYNPPPGAVGHAASMLFGADSKSELEADMFRMKNLIESEILSRDVAQREYYRGAARHYGGRKIAI